MAIVKQTLHPEGDTGTDIYPKTSTDQIADLPTSAKSQLYAHYIYMWASNEEYIDFGGTLFFINGISAPINSLDDLSTQIEGTGVIVGGGYIRKIVPASIKTPIQIPIGSYIVGEGRANVGEYENDIRINIVRLDSPGGTYVTSLKEILGSTATLNISDYTVAVGSNAG